MEPWSVDRRSQILTMQALDPYHSEKFDPDPHQSEKFDLDPHQSEKFDPDPHHL